MKKKRTSLCVLSIIGVILLLCGVGGYLYSILGNAKDLYGVPFGAMNEEIIKNFSTFTEGRMVQSILTIALSAVALILIIIWIIVGVKRDRKVWIWFSLFFLAAVYGNLCYDALYSLKIKSIIAEVSKGLALSFDVLVLPIGALCVVLSVLFILICFIIDMATGNDMIYENGPLVNEAKVEEATPEVIPAPAVEAPVESAPVSEPVKEEPAPIEEVKEEPAPVPEVAVVAAAEVSKPSKKPAKKQAKKKTSPKKEDKKPVSKKPAKKEAVKPAPKKEAPKKAEANETKVYHVSKRTSDNRWTIKFAGGERVIKTFRTKAEAVEYADVLAKNQDGIVLTHASKGAKQGKINAKRKALK